MSESTPPEDHAGQNSPYQSPPSVKPEASSPAVKAAKGQPSGLWVLFITEMWERFSYYGMRALLVFYLVSKTTADNPGFGWEAGSAAQFYGWFTCFCYLTPLVGGLLADKFLGTHRSMLVGGVFIAMGQFCLAATEFWGLANVDCVLLGTAPAHFLTFMAGLFLIIIGTGFFKPCVSVMVGQLYSSDDPRRDSGFTIFYMGINVGALLSTLIAGTLGEKVGWHWGFGSASAGMLLGLVVYSIARPFFLKGVGLPPHHQPEHEADHQPTPEQIKQAEIDEHERTRPLTRVDWDRMAVIVILSLFSVFFWAAFEQAGTSLNLFAKDATNRDLAFVESIGIPSLEQHLPASWQDWRSLFRPFPATWFQSVNPLAIVIFAPVFAWLWVRLEKRKLQPSTPMKFAIGLVLLAVGNSAMIFGALQASANGLAGPHWLLITYIVATWGELCLSPVGLSMVTKLSPARYTSLMMGVYFLMMSLSNLTAGYVASSASYFVERGEAGEGWLAGQADFFVILTVVPIVIGAIVMALVPSIKRMMHGLN
ncbi:MAG: peptide MFS transporter [Pirellulales bacterium]|nr:peptide MFS transporter [Pirellulales bacterium]